MRETNKPLVLTLVHGEMELNLSRCRRLTGTRAHECMVSCEKMGTVSTYSDPSTDQAVGCVGEKVSIR